MEKRKPRSRKKKTFGLKGWAIIGGTTAAAALLTAFVYLQIGRQYEKVFFPNTEINGIDASKKTVEEVKKMIASGIDGYTLSIQERGGRTEEIRGSDIGLESVFDGSLEALLAKQEPEKWIKHLKMPQTFQIDTMIRFDQNKFQKAVSGLTCFKEEYAEKPENAYITDYEPGQGYHIAAAKEGTLLEPEKGKDILSEAILDRKPEISLETAYVQPEIPSEDPHLTKQVQTLNTYINAAITYTFGNEEQVIDGETISKWVGIGTDGNVYLDSSRVIAYVKELASRYDTYNKAKSLMTSYGQRVSITGGSYGWRINQSAEADELAELIRNGKSQVREPVYQQKGVDHGAMDYGNTYVEINLTAQHLYFYKNGKLKLESDFVSGNQSKGWSTPAGVYSLTYKQKNAVLNGENYSTPVSYWMPFNGNIGLHDATWRNAFGGTIYKSHGSHGCINLPPAFAKKLFENIYTGIPVLCYHLAGTQSEESDSTPPKPEETAAVEETTAEETKAEETTAEETTAEETTAGETTAEETTVEDAAEETTEEETAAAPSTESGPAAATPPREQRSGTGSHELAISWKEGMKVDK